jgi:protein-tyrosine-phosphatase
MPQVFPIVRDPTCLDRRGLLAFAAILFAAPAVAAHGANPCPAPRVLFVCPAGTVKSAIARETLKRRAAAAGLAVTVRSRGIHVEDHVSPALAANLKAGGIDPAAEPARALSPTDIAEADLVIAFDEASDAPGMSRARTWDIPSWNSDYAGASRALSRHIDALMAELAVRGCAA